MEVGLVLLGHDGVADDAAYAEEHGFHTAGFVDSPLLYADPFVSMALTAERTSTLRIGAMLAIPSNRNAASLVTAMATVNRLAPGRTFLGIGTGFTGRAVFGLGALPVARFTEYVRSCRALLDGDEVLHHDAGHVRHIRLRHAEGRYIDPTQIPIYMAADGPRALAATGEAAEGWITSLQRSHYMETSVDVFTESFAAVRRAAAQAGRSMDDAYTMASAGFCVLDEGESPTSERALEHIGAYAMLPFHAYADNPGIAEYLPPPIHDRLEVYEREVLARFDVAADRRYQETHRGHLSHLLDGEAEVLTDDIVRMTPHGHGAGDRPAVEAARGGRPAQRLAQPPAAPGARDGAHVRREGRAAARRDARVARPGAPPSLDPPSGRRIASVRAESPLCQEGAAC